MGLSESIVPGLALAVLGYLVGQVGDGPDAAGQQLGIAADEVSSGIGTGDPEVRERGLVEPALSLSSTETWSMTGGGRAP